MLIVALLISTLAVRVRDQAERGAPARAAHARCSIRAEPRAGRRPRRPRRSRRRPAARWRTSSMGRSQVLLPDAEGRLGRRARRDALVPGGRARAGGRGLGVHACPAAPGVGTDTLPGAAALYLPLPGGEGALGVLGVRAAPRPAAPLARPARPAGDAGPADRGAAASARSVRAGRAGAPRSRARAPARHAPELGLARPAHAAVGDHRRGQQPAGRRVAGSRARARADPDDLRGGLAAEPAGGQPARHDAPGGGHGRAEAGVALPGGGRGGGAGARGRKARRPPVVRPSCRQTCRWCPSTGC